LLRSAKLDATFALFFFYGEGEMQDFDKLCWSGVLEDEELQVQDAIANSSKKTSNGSSPSVVHSEPATLPVLPVQQILPAHQQETKAPPVQQIPPVPEAKQTGTHPLFIFLVVKYVDFAPLFSLHHCDF
jgi:hypothetical protein